MRTFRVILVAALLGMGWPLTATATPVTVAKADKCPVCGMFVARYPDFVAQIIFTDGTYAVFDGAKDMFKYYFNLGKYNPAKRPADIAFLYVTDYYSMKPVDGRAASYVVGSDVFGPMGRELIPFGQEKEAQLFMKDHAGKKMIRFEAVTPELLKELD